MAQTTQITIDNQTFPSFRSKLNESLSALNTLNSGTSRPSSAVAGTIWLDTTNATNPTLKFFDGNDDISLATIDYTANTVNWLDSSVTLTSPVEISGNSTAGAEIRLPEDTDNGSNYVGLKASDSIASNITFTLPSTDGSADQVLKTDGSGNLSFTDVTGGTSWQSSIKTSGFTAVAGEGYSCNTTSAGFTVTLPSSASVGDTIQIVDYAGTFATNNIILTSSLNINGATNDKALKTNREGVSITYVDVTQGWVATSGVNSGDQALDLAPYSVSYLCVAGGGAGGAAYQSGGGGAGGMLTGTLNFNLGITYTATVGAGGSGVTNDDGTNGVNSTISGSDITTVTSIGGGGGRLYRNITNGIAGGSGGGVGTNGTALTGGSGTVGQGNKGGDVVSSNSSPYQGSGGGGAGAVGTNGGGSSTLGTGGAGLASSITGSSVTYAGGGGGSNFAGGDSSYGVGGAGGGGNGGREGDSYGGTAGTANTGGGGGAARTSSTAGNAGGSGVVILSVPTANYSGTTTGSPTITTSGSNTIIKFTGTGTYTG